MKERTAAKRYARSLFELTLESGQIESLNSDMTILKQIVARVPSFSRALADQRIDLGRRLATAKLISEALGLSALTRDTVLLLISRRRLSLIEFMVDDVLRRILVYKKMATASAEVADASCAEEVKLRIEEILAKALACSVSCDMSVDPSILGGFVLKLGDLRFDASVNGRLAKMKEQLLAE